MIRVSVFKRLNPSDGSYTLGLAWYEGTKAVKRSCGIRTGPKPNAKELRACWAEARKRATEKMDELNDDTPAEIIIHMPLRQGMAEFSSWCRAVGPDGIPNAADSTIEGNSRDIREFIEHVERDLPGLKVPLMTMGKVNRNQVALWRNSLAKRGLAANTCNKMMAAISSFCAWALDHGYVSVNPVVGVKRYKAKNRRRSRLEIQTPADFWALIEKLPEGKPRETVILLGCTGLRSGELRGLKWSDVDEAALTVAEGRETTKHHFRVIPLCQQAVAALAALARSSHGPLVVASASERPLSSQVGSWMKAHRCTPHDLRRFAITAWETIGAPKDVVDDLAGHSAGTVRASYTPQSNIEAARPWVEKFGAWLGER